MKKVLFKVNHVALLNLAEADFVVFGTETNKQKNTSLIKHKLKFQLQVGLFLTHNSAQWHGFVCTL